MTALLFLYFLSGWRYTGNDDSILADLLTTFELGGAPVRIAGGLLGHWAFWTRRAVEYLQAAKTARCSGAIPASLLTLAQQITDANAAVFDPQNSFRGCIPGIHEILRRQGLLAGRYCLDEHEDLSTGQSEEIDRVCRLYPHLADDDFVRKHLKEFLA